MTTPEKFLTGFLCLAVAACMGFAGALIWYNTTRPAYTVESCTEVKVKRGEP